MAMINFCKKINIILGHSTTYYPQGNDLAESSNKSLTTVINKILTENKKMWHIHLKYALWPNMISTKREIEMSPFQMVYDTDVILPINLALLVMKLWKDSNEEPNNITRRASQLVEVQQNRVEVNEKLQRYQDKMKALFDQKPKNRDFYVILSGHC
jgi:hypothetical protein